MSDDNGGEHPDQGKSGKFGQKFKNSTRRVKTKAQEAAQRAAEQASRAGDVISDAASTAGERIKEGGSTAGDKLKQGGSAAAENVRDLGDRAGDAVGDARKQAEAILDALGRAGSSVGDAAKDGGDKLSTEARLALDVIRARYPDLEDDFKDQIEIVANMDPQAHRQLVFAYATFATRWIPVFGARFATRQLIKRLGKYIDDNKAAAPKKQRGVVISTLRWRKEYSRTKQLLQKENAQQEKGNDGPQLQ